MGLQIHFRRGLDLAFTEIAKKYIHSLPIKIHNQKSNNINVHCPICGEGNSPWKHRGYFLFNTKDDSCVYYCFNCMEEGMSFYNYMKEYTDSFNSFVQEIKKDKISSFKEKVREKEELSNVFDFSEKKEPKEKEETLIELHKHALKDVLLFDDTYYKISDLNDSGYDYMIGRGFSREEIESMIEKREILWLEGKSMLIFPFWWSDKVYGFQGRSIENKFFWNEVFENPKVYNLYSLYKKGKMKSTTPVYVFESIFNMMSTNFENKLAMMGKTFPKEIIDYCEVMNWEPVFCFDNDTPGKNMAIKYSNMGFKTLVHDRNFPVNDFNDALKMGISKEKITRYIEEKVCTPMLANKRLRIG